MHTLLVAANPEPRSLTHYVLGRLEAALPPGSVEIADLAAEGFDPRFTPADRRAYHAGGNYPADVAAEHRRLERATDLVLVFPVYWWSMPALLKGWIDRVFANGWAFTDSPASGWQPKLQALTIHLLPIAGVDARACERHGYENALRTQIEHGIIDYCGSRRGSTTFLHESEQLTPETTVREVDRVVRIITEAIHARPTAGTAGPASAGLPPVGSQ
ncbi:NAD(P)H-dependent oxidoreductase [Streptomyces sp. NRRL F-5630]|uniref:NAD(P)H-dependent oxidoreductase n=1 Tax=Streptomyces sp. NRRL F-5630 TaxID=1463864 RepID=UPI003D757FD6